MSYYSKEKGITLIALVITIIVSLILTGITLASVVGDDGLIAKAQESVMLSKLGDILFETESDITAIKIDSYAKKLNTSQILQNLSSMHSEKYYLNLDFFENTGLSTICLKLKNSPITSLVINLTGNVYVDNYKRGKIQLSDVFEKIKVEGLYYGESNIKINDGTVKPSSNRGFYDITYVNENEAVPWINGNNEIIAWSNKFGIYPIGIQDYEFATYDSKLSQDFYDSMNNKYALFPTVKCVQQNNKFIMEANLFHFAKTVDLSIGKSISEESETAETNTITLGGTYITEVGVRFSDTEDFERTVNFEMYTPVAYYHTPEEYSYNKVYLLYFDDMEKELNKVNMKTSRLYYVPYIKYKKYSHSVIEYEKEVFYYYDEIYSYIANTVKFIDVKT